MRVESDNKVKVDKVKRLKKTGSLKVIDFAKSQVFELAFFNF